MSRYIYADDVHRAISKVWVDMSIGDIITYMHMLDDAIDDLPTADVVEVVRCKDCRFFNDGDCTQVARLVGEQSYCDLGERGEE